MMPHLLEIDCCHDQLVVENRLQSLPGIHPILLRRNPIFLPQRWQLWRFSVLAEGEGKQSSALDAGRPRYPVISALFSVFSK